MSIMTHDTNHAATAGLPTANYPAGATRTLVVSFLTRAGRAIWQGVKAHREISAQRLLVASLSDRQLADLGISREFIQRRDFMDPHAV
jgi:uncharacterized protein YjiS (DUF1127 family)